MGLKENFAQALNELTGGSKTGKDEKKSQVEDMRRAVDDEPYEAVKPDEGAAAMFADQPKKEEVPADLDINLSQFGGKAPETEAYTPETEAFSPDTKEEVKEEQPKRDFSFNPNADIPKYTSPFMGNTNYNTYEQPAQPSPQARREDENELTVISKNTVIDGNIRSFANMSIDGDIKGDVETTKNMELNGKIVGNIVCNNAAMHTSQIQGNIQMKGNVTMDRDTLLIGDLISTYANINGKVKGNLEINGKAELKSDAVVFGDISASTITVDDGAIIQGYVSTTFLNKEESKNIFPDTITIE